MVISRWVFKSLALVSLIYFCAQREAHVISEGNELMCKFMLLGKNLISLRKVFNSLEQYLNLKEYYLT